MSKTTTIAEMFSEAFGLDHLTMKVNKPIYVGEANMGILGRKGNESPTLNRVLYAVKKDKAIRYLIQLSSGQELTVSAAHKFAVGNTWIEAKNLTLADKLVGENLAPVEILTITKLPRGHTLDIQVEGAETYFSQGVLSHNSIHGPDFKVGDGRAIKFYASNRSRITKIDTIKDKGEIIGIEMKVKNGKNKAGIPFREAILQLYFDGGFDTNKEYMDFIVQLGIVEQAGAWFNNEKYGIHLKGREALQTWLNEHPAEYEEIKVQVNSALAGKTVLDVEGATGYDEEDSSPEFTEIDPNDVIDT